MYEIGKKAIYRLKKCSEERWALTAQQAKCHIGRAERMLHELSTQFLVHYYDIRLCIDETIASISKGRRKS